MDGDQTHALDSAANAPSKLVPRLSVMAGMHTGARLSLVDMPICVIGSAPHCDVILRDPSVAAEHLTVISRQNGAVVRALGGPFMVDGNVIAQGGVLAVTDGMSLDLGEAKVMLSLVAHDSVDHVREEAGSVSKRTSESSHAAEVATPLLTSTGTSASKSGRKATVALVSIGALFVVAAVALSATESLRASTKGNLALLEQRLFGANFAGVSAKEKGGVILLSGFVTSSAEKQNLQEILTPFDGQMKIENNVETGSDVSRRVKDSFRIGGVTANTQYMPQGRVVAEVKPADMVNATLAKDGILKDLRTLRALEIVPMKIAEAAPAPPTCVNPMANREGLKLQYVVSTEPAYMQVADGTKYYAEGRLPTGHVIKRITDEQIFLDCGGVASVVTF